MTRKDFFNVLTRYFPWVDEQTFISFEKYKTIIQKYNQIFNLTRLDSDDKIYQNFFLDSLAPYKELDFFTQNTNLGLIDIGSGSGIPGVVLKIIFKNLNLTLLEANQKRCEFLKILTQELGLNDVLIWNMRAEDLTQSMRESFDVATPRAVASLDKILEISAAFVKVNGYLIQPKSIKFYEEELKAKNIIKTLYLERIALKDFWENDYHHLVGVYLKKQITPLQFPRPWNLILKKPL